MRVRERLLKLEVLRANVQGVPSEDVLEHTHTHTHTGGDIFVELDKWELVERVKDVSGVSRTCSNIWRVA